MIAFLQNELLLNRRNWGFPKAKKINSSRDKIWTQAWPQSPYSKSRHGRFPVNLESQVTTRHNSRWTLARCSVHKHLVKTFPSLTRWWNTGLSECKQIVFDKVICFRNLWQIFSHAAVPNLSNYDALCSRHVPWEWFLWSTASGPMRLAALHRSGSASPRSHPRSHKGNGILCDHSYPWLGLWSYTHTVLL